MIDAARFRVCCVSRHVVSGSVFVLKKKKINQHAGQEMRVEHPNLPRTNILGRI